MAIPIGPNNPSFLQRLDPVTAENLRQTGGTASVQSTDKFERDCAEKPLTETDELQLASQAGVTQEGKPGSRSQEKRTEQAQQRATEAALQDGAGHNQGDTADKVQARLTAAKLAAYDDPETVYQKVLDDIPESHLEAAEKVMETQMKQGASKMSNLKSGPEAEEAGRMEMRPAKFHGTLDISEGRTEPLPLDFPDEA